MQFNIRAILLLMLLAALGLGTWRRFVSHTWPGAWRTCGYRGSLHGRKIRKMSERSSIWRV